MEKFKASRIRRAAECPPVRFVVDLDLEEGTAYIMNYDGSDLCSFDVSSSVDVGRAVVAFLRDWGGRT